MSHLFRSPAVDGLGSVSLLDADDTISGAIPLPASPVAGTLDAGSDPTDVYSVTLAAGERLRVVLTGSALLNADAYLYDPTVTDENVSYAVVGTLGDGFPKMLRYDVRQAERVSTMWLSTPRRDPRLYRDVADYAIPSDLTMTSQASCQEHLLWMVRWTT